MGAVVTYYQNSRFENMVIEDNATVGIGVYNANAVVQSVTSRRNGLSGGNVHRADGVQVIDSLFEANNDQNFNRAPSAGGLKITKSRPVTVRESVFRNTNGHGLWLDEAVQNATVVDNDFVDNTGIGVICEISSSALIANNVATNNGMSGIRITNSDNVAIWNNTVRHNRRALDMAKDNRDGSDPSIPGHDTRYPAQSWMLENVSVGNNILQAGEGANATFAVENYDHRFDADSMNVRSDGNIYLTSSAFEPRWQAVWARAGHDPWVYTALSGFQEARGQEAHSIQAPDTSDYAASFANVARPVPGEISAATSADLSGTVGAVR